MCYVHNQWYDISCATLYYCPYQTCIRSKGLLQPWYKDADGVKYYEKQTAFKLRPVLNSCPIHANFITKKIITGVTVLQGPLVTTSMVFSCHVTDLITRPN